MNLSNVFLGLVLVTCGGPFDTRTRTYRDNVVVTAELEPRTPDA